MAQDISNCENAQHGVFFFLTADWLEVVDPEERLRSAPKHGVLSKSRDIGSWYAQLLSSGYEGPRLTCAECRRNMDMNRPSRKVTFEAFGDGKFEDILPDEDSRMFLVSDRVKVLLSKFKGAKFVPTEIQCQQDDEIPRFWSLRGSHRISESKIKFSSVAANSCVHCGASPVICAECGFGSHFCRKCKKRTACRPAEIEKLPGLIVDRRRNDCIALSSWNGDDICAFGTSVIVTKAVVAALQKAKVSPFLADSMAYDAADKSTIKWQKHLDEIAKKK